MYIFFAMKSFFIILTIVTKLLQGVVVGRTPLDRGYVLHGAPADTPNIESQVNDIIRKALNRTGESNSDQFEAKLSAAQYEDRYPDGFIKKSFVAPEKIYPILNKTHDTSNSMNAISLQKNDNLTVAAIIITNEEHTTKATANEKTADAPLIQSKNASRMKAQGSVPATHSSDSSNDDNAMSIGATLVVSAAMTLFLIAGYVAYKQHVRNRSITTEKDREMMKSLLDDDMDYAAI